MRHALPALVALVLAACAAPQPPAPEPVAPARPTKEKAMPAQPTFGASAPADVPDPFARLPAPKLPAPTGPVLEKPAGPIAPPLPTATAVPWPPPAPPVGAAPPVVPAPELAVLRASPEGRQDLAGRVSVTFNQPMVPVADVREVNAREVPLVLEPQPAGKFRWLDVSTLVFEAEPRLPMATAFTARVRAGVKSAFGKALSKEYSWTFETGLPQLLDVTPYEGTQTLSPSSSFALRFNARMDAALAKGRITLAPAKGKPVELEITSQGQGEEANRVLVVTPRAPLPIDTRFTLHLDADLRCAEGPLPLGTARDLGFSTYGPLKVERIECNGDCVVGTPISVAFNNPLKSDLKLGDWIHVSPEAKVEISGWGQYLQISGDFRANRTYTVTVEAGLPDAFGQKLARAERKSFTFKAPPPQWELQGDGQLSVIAPGREKALGVAGTSVAKVGVRLGKIEPKQLVQALSSLRNHDGDAVEKPFFAIAGITDATKRDVTLAAGDEAHAKLALDDALNPAGHGLVAVEVSGPRIASDWRPWKRMAFVQVTELGVNVAFDGDRLAVLGTALATAQPIDGLALELWDSKGHVLATTRTDAAGTGSFAVPSLDDDLLPLVVSASTQADRAIVIVEDWMLSRSGHERAPRVRGTVFLDRGVFRPGEELHGTIVLRRETVGPKGDLESMAGTHVGWNLDSQGKNVAKGEATLSRFGTAPISVKIPADAPLGAMWLQVSTEAGGVTGTQVRVEEFRTPEFLVETAVKSTSPAFLGDEAQFGVGARYLFGAPMSGMSFEWHLTRSEGAFTPPGWPAFQFGWEDVHWFRHRRWDGPDEIAQGKGTLDASGAATVKAQLDRDESTHGAGRFEFSATVFDANRQAVGSSTGVLAQRASLLVGLRVGSRVLKADEAANPEVVVVGLDGAPRADVPVKVELVTEDGLAPAQACEVKSTRTPVSCKLQGVKAGSYRVRATVTDPQGRTNEASLRVWVVGGLVVGGSKVEPTAQLILDRTTYAPGDMAHVTISSTVSRGRGWLVLGREGLAELRPVELRNGAATIDLPIREEWIPGIQCDVIVDTGDDGAPSRLVRANTTIAIENKRRAISVEVTPSSVVAAPGGELTVTLRTTGADGAAVTSGVTLMVVDEGVLSVTGYETPDLLAVMYAGARESGTRLVDVRELFTAEDWYQGPNGGFGDKRAMKMAEVASMERGPGGGAPSFDVRSVFASAAFFDGAIETDADGRASRTFKLPDNLTEFRIMAVALDDARRFGSGVSKVNVRKPVLVRPSLPRFANVGDRFEASATVHNETGADADFLVQLRADNATVETGRQRIALKNGEKREVRFTAAAGVPGPALYQFAAVALTRAQPTDAVEITIPTQVPATAEAFATYGATESADRLPIAAPKDALPGWGGLEVQLSSTALTGLSDAVKYLVEYPYECAEQTASRLIPLVALKPIMWPFGSGTATEEYTRRQIAKRAVQRLVDVQRADGGYALWSESRDASTYLTAYVLSALELAKASGMAVPEETLQRAASWLEQLLRRSPTKDAWWDGPAARSFALVVLARRGVELRDELARLVKEDSLPTFAVAWLYETAFRMRTDVTALERRLTNAAVESAGAIHFAERRTEALRLIMHSEDRTDAIVLSALMVAAPRHPMVDKLARGVMRSRVNGRWSTTQANAFALVGLRDYFDVYEADTPAFDARVWQGDRFLGGRRFEGREMTLADLTVPIAEVGQGDVVVGKQGTGRLYWRAGLRYALREPPKTPEMQGFVVERTYEAVSPTDAVKRAPDGSWRVKAGATVRVRLGITTPDRRYYAAVVDPMPAGFESIDPSLANSARTGPQGRGDDGVGGFEDRWFWWSPWSHKELRDDRVQLFADDLSAGVYAYTYLARATAIGRFIVPPARAEEMYAPETFGRTAGDVVIVEE